MVMTSLPNTPPIGQVSDNGYPTVVKSAATWSAPTNSKLANLRSELAAIAARFEAANQRAWQATTIEDRNAAEAERLEAEGDFWVGEADIADLLLLLFRITLRHQPDALRHYVAAALRPHLDEITMAIARLEARHEHHG
jgi:hypothetical protein